MEFNNSKTSNISGSTKLHGCLRLDRGKIYARLFWLFSALSTAVIFIIVIAELADQYGNGNIVTQVTF